MENEDLEARRRIIQIIIDTPGEREWPIYRHTAERIADRLISLPDLMKQASEIPIIRNVSDD